MGRFARVAKAVVDSARPEAPRSYRTGSSGSPVFVGRNTDDVSARLARSQAAFAVKAQVDAERKASRGWDWDRSVPDALFYGQRTSSGPADAEAEAAQATRRASDLFDLSDWSDSLA